MSYKVEMTDEYSFGQWFSHSLRFATEAEAEECSHHISNVGWNGILDLRVVASDDPVNARWTEAGVADKDGQPFHRPTPDPTLEETLAEANRLRNAWTAIVARIGQ